MNINKNCYLCKGTGRVENEHGKFRCPECEYADLYEKAMSMKEDKFYKYKDDEKEEIERMYGYFRDPTANHNWHIQLYSDNRVRRVDWSWMDMY